MEIKCTLCRFFESIVNRTIFPSNLVVVEKGFDICEATWVFVVFVVVVVVFVWSEENSSPNQLPARTFVLGQSEQKLCDWSTFEKYRKDFFNWLEIEYKRKRDGKLGRWTGTKDWNSHASHWVECWHDFMVTHWINQLRFNEECILTQSMIHSINVHAHTSTHTPTFALTQPLWNILKEEQI